MSLPGGSPLTQATVMGGSGQSCAPSWSASRASPSSRCPRCVFLPSARWADRTLGLWGPAVLRLPEPSQVVRLVPPGLLLAECAEPSAVVRPELVEALVEETPAGQHPERADHRTLGHAVGA